MSFIEFLSLAYWLVFTVAQAHSELEILSDYVAYVAFLSCLEVLISSKGLPFERDDKETHENRSVPKGYGARK